MPRLRSRRASGLVVAIALACGVGAVALDSPQVALASQTKPTEDVYAFGDATFHGSTGSLTLAHVVVGMASSPSGDGYYEVAADGGIFAFGDAKFYGSTGAIRLNRSIVAMAATPTGRGYWLVAADGGIFAFGDAKFYGSTGAIRLNRPIVAMAATPTGRGYWLVAADGGIFAFGDAKFYGSTGAIRLNRPIVGVAATPTGRGYWLVATDGGIFAFGDAKFYGSTGGLRLVRPIAGMASTPSGRGYWLAAADGGVFAFGDAGFHGSMGMVNLGRKGIVGIVASASGNGYAMVATRPVGPPTASPPPAPPPPPPPVPSSRRIEAAFVTSFSGPDTLAVRYYSHDATSFLSYKCTSPTEDFSYYTTGFAETWASVGDCTAGTRHNRLAAKLATNYSAPDVLYLRIYYSPTVYFRFACTQPARYHYWTPSSSTETWKALTPCSIDTGTPPPPSVCGRAASPPTTYQHIVVIMEENRTWSQVGGPGFGGMPYTQSYAAQCAYYSQWLETNPQQNSLTQYIGLTSGVDNPATFNNCLPSATCRSTDDNIFRQVRDAGGTARTYVEGATTGCDGTDHPVHVPALYYFGGDDHSFCSTEVRPLSEMNVNSLPTFAMIIPTMCNNGHNCSNDTVDAWLKLQLGSLLGSSSYVAGTTAVFVLYDEDRPMPNLVIAPTAHTGQLTSPVAGHSAALRTIEEMLGLPVLPSVSGSVSLRASAHI